uniref:HD-GYP domain-containing protein n=1 Tax=Sphingomonas bacterium TaxID=1895847 RepID=UPI00260A5B7F|nr:HD-GYP domain-containing protein [Sphingomonas bacterium]
MRHRAPTPADALQTDDWRGPDAVPTAVPRRPVARAATTITDRLHLNARKAGAARERDRAREIVAVGKEAVTGAFAAIRDGLPIPIRALAPVVEAIAASVARDAAAMHGVTRLKQRHEYTYLHSVSVCGLMIGLAHVLEMDPALIPEIGLAGLLHDIGKARVPNLLLDKPGPLTDAEFALVRTHSERGHELLLRAGVDSPIALDVCLHHHERPDGRGYPERLFEDQVSRYARMGAICDVYDAVTSARAYKDSWTPGEALEWMAETEGQFDRKILSLFSAMIGPLSVGTVVRLASDRLALVVEDGEAERPPIVVAFHCALTDRPLPLRIVEGRHDAITGVERAARWRFEDWRMTKRAAFAFHAAARG